MSEPHESVAPESAHPPVLPVARAEAAGTADRDHDHKDDNADGTPHNRAQHCDTDVCSKVVILHEPSSSSRSHHPLPAPTPPSSVAGPGAPDGCRGSGVVDASRDGGCGRGDRGHDGMAQVVRGGAVQLARLHADEEHALGLQGRIAEVVSEFRPKISAGLPRHEIGSSLGPWLIHVAVQGLLGRLPRVENSRLRGALRPRQRGRGGSVDVVVFLGVVVVLGVFAVLGAPEALERAERPDEQPAIPTTAATVANPAIDFRTMALTEPVGPGTARSLRLVVSAMRAATPRRCHTAARR